MSNLMSYMRFHLKLFLCACPWVLYFDDGQLWAKGDFKKGEMEGSWVEYRGDGQLLSEGNYTDGKREGPWIVYNSDGTVWEEHTGIYANGVKVD